MHACKHNKIHGWEECLDCEGERTMTRDRIHKELVAAVGGVLTASPNLPGWKSAWNRLERAHKAALALLPDPPGECCRRAREALEMAMGIVNNVSDCAYHDDYGRVRELVAALPLPGAKEGA